MFTIALYSDQLVFFTMYVKYHFLVIRGGHTFSDIVDKNRHLLYNYTIINVLLMLLRI